MYVKEVEAFPYIPRIALAQHTLHCRVCFIQSLLPLSQSHPNTLFPWYCICNVISGDDKWFSDVYELSHSVLSHFFRPHGL